MHGDEELDALQVAVDVTVEDREVSALDIVLHGELLSCRLISRGVIGSVPIGGASSLDRESLGDAEEDREIALHAHVRKGQNAVVSRSLYENGIVPVEPLASFQSLADFQSEDVHLLAVLMRAEILGREIVIVADVLDANAYTGVGAGISNLALDADMLLAVEIIVPAEVIAEIMVHQVGDTPVDKRTLCLHDETVASETKRISLAERNDRLQIAVDVDIAHLVARESGARRCVKCEG